jgi:hypothetical protein
LIYEVRITQGFVFLVLLILCLGGWTVFGQKQEGAQVQWEYLVTRTSLPYENTTGDFNKLGSQGWELVNVNEDGLACFKRQKR